MNARDLETAVPQIARNEMFYFIARICMICGTVIGVPMAGFLMTRIINQADALQMSVAQQNVDIRVLSATVKDRLDNNVRQLSDHELRLRSLERRN